MKSKFEPNPQEYPFQFRVFETEGVNMHYIDEGSGPILLFVHGTPSWSYDFRKVILELKNRYRCIAPDHIGFGLSDKPEKFDYSTMAHARRMEQWMRYLKAEDVTLILHDFGGPIGWQAALNMPDKIRNIVFINTWLRSSEGERDFEKMKIILKSPLLPFLYRYLNFSARFLLPQSFGNRKLSAGERQPYIRPFAKRAMRSGPLAFARSLLHDQQWFEQLWEQREKLQHTRKMILWGDKDPVVKMPYLSRLMESFPEASAVIISGAGHFPQEEAPQQVLDALLPFLSEGNQ